MVNLTVCKLDMNKSDFKKNSFNYIFTHVCNFHRSVHVTTHAVFRALGFLLLFSLAFSHSSLLLYLHSYFSILDR